MVSENKEYNKALKELIKMGKKSGSLTEKQVVEKTLTLELTDEELDNLYNSIKEEGIKITDEDSSDATAKEVVKESTLTFTDVLKDLIETGKKDGFLTYETIAKKTTNLEMNSNNLDELYNALNENNIEIRSEDETDVDASLLTEDPELNIVFIKCII